MVAFMKRCFRSFRVPALSLCLLFCMGAAPTIMSAQTGDWSRIAANALLFSSSSQLRNQIHRSGAVMLQRRVEVPSISIGDGKRVAVEAISVYEAGLEQERVMGLRLDWGGYGSVGELRYTFLDLHEIDSVIRGIIYMTSEFAREVREREQIAEGRILTREGFFVGYEAKGDRMQPFIGWEPANLRRPLNPDGFYEIRERFELAREALFAD